MDSRVLHFTKLIRQYIDKAYFEIWGDKHSLDKLRNEVKGKPILVVGNGPSLNKTPLDKFNSGFSIGMNKIDLIFPRTSWKPNIIVVINGTVIMQHKNQYKASEIPIFMDVKGRYLGVKGKNVNYFLGKFSSDFSKDYSKGLGSGGTVTYSALQLAYILGASEVVLVGVDHSFNQTGTKYVTSKGDDPNHFDPNYFGKGSVWGLPDLEACEMVYRKAKKAFEDDGRKIYDATIGGKLEIFDKISVDEAISIFDKSNHGS